MIEWIPSNSFHTHLPNTNARAIVRQENFQSKDQLFCQEQDPPVEICNPIFLICYRFLNWIKHCLCVSSRPKRAEIQEVEEYTLPAALIRWVETNLDAPSTEELWEAIEYRIEKWQQTQTIELHDLPDERQTDEILIWIAENFPDLEQLDLGLSLFSNQGLQAVGEKCAHLRVISFHSSNITDEGIRLLVSTVSAIEELQLSNTSISDISLFAIAQNCPFLKRIYLDSTRITDRGVCALAENCPDLSLYDLQNTQTGDAACEQIGFCSSNLCSIALGANTTDIGLQALIKTRKPHLISIALQGTITIEALKEAIYKTPSVRFIYKMDHHFKFHAEEYLRQIKKFAPLMHI